jgi:tetratricopeptide (TPR) repeat protein
VPAAAVLALLALWLGVIAVRRWRDGPLAAGALGALVAVMLQSNVDFGVELLGVAAPLVAIIATLAYVPVREGKPQGKLVVRGVRIVHVAALVGMAWLLVGATATRSLEEDHRALGEARDSTMADVQQLVERHPLDYFNFARAAELFEHTGDAKAVRVLNHALALHPTHPGLHLMAARLLYGAHFPDQAALEYAQAVIPTRDKRALLGEIASRLSPAQAAAAIPSSADWRPELARELEELGHTDVELAWLVRSLELAPRDLHPGEQRYQLAAKHGDRASLDALLAHCADYQPATDVLLALAKSLEDKHEYAEALKLLGDVENWHGRTDEQLVAWFAACDAHAGLGEWDEARRCVRRLDASGIVPPARANEITGWLEQLDQARAAAALRASGSGAAAGPASRSPATGTTPAPR